MAFTVVFVLVDQLLDELGDSAAGLEHAGKSLVKKHSPLGPE